MPIQNLGGIKIARLRTAISVPFRYWSAPVCNFGRFLVCCIMHIITVVCLPLCGWQHKIVRRPRDFFWPASVHVDR